MNCLIGRCGEVEKGATGRVFCLSAPFLDSDPCYGPREARAVRPKDDGFAVRLKPVLAAMRVDVASTLREE
jgi:hypothetical protein